MKATWMQKMLVVIVICHIIYLSYLTTQKKGSFKASILNSSQSLWCEYFSKSVMWIYPSPSFYPPPLPLHLTDRSIFPHKLWKLSKLPIRIIRILVRNARFKKAKNRNYLEIMLRLTLMNSFQKAFFLQTSACAILP